MVKLLKKLRYLPVALPLVFVMIFLGYLPPKYDIVLYTDNIVGEGLCETVACSPVSFSPYYMLAFYFGSELKEATIEDYNYDVRYFRLTFSDVAEAEIEGFDLRVFGHTLGHYSLRDITPLGEFDGLRTSLSEDGARVRFSFEDPAKGTTIEIASHFAPAWFWIAYAALILLLSALLSLLLGAVAERFCALRLPMLSAAALMATLLAGCFFCGSLPYMGYANFLLNWALLFALSLALNAVTLPFLGTVATMAFATVWYIANYYVILYRSKPIMPADLKAAGTAAEVMGSYSFTPGWKMIAGVIVVAGYAAAVVLLWKRTKPQQKQPVKYRLLQRAGAMLTAAALVILGVRTDTFRSLESFAWDAALLRSFHVEGMVLTYLKSALNSSVKRPEGYSQEAVARYLAEYRAGKAESNQADGVRPTRIIMIMDEAFSDLRTVGLDQRIDVMPFIDSLDQNTVEGSLYVSVFGGGTCNTEFEGLTGNTLAFLGTGAYPYTDSVTEPLFSLASYFGGTGYLAEAFHANEAHNWNRNMVYPNLGFSAFHDIDDYSAALGEVPRLHKLPADIADYSYIAQTDAQTSSRPRFLFCVTMQNHSGYEHWEDVQKADTVDAYGADLYLDTQVYLSLIRASDAAVQQLVETYRNSDEPTMIVFFGDHQPGLPAYARSEIYSDLKSQLDLYKSKFFLWTNYASDAAHGVEVSANYLPYLILKQGNFPCPPYIQMLGEVYEKYPVISAMGVVDAEGNVYNSVYDILDDPLIQKYQYIQYANLYDTLDPAWFDAG